MGSAILFSKVEGAESRFPDFLAELRGFLTHYGVPVETPEAVSTLADRVAAAGAFRDDLASMLNVLCAAEERISYLELLGLLLVATAGSEEAPFLALDAGAEEPVQRIFNFVVEVRQPPSSQTEAPESASMQDEETDPVEPEVYVANAGIQDLAPLTFPAPSIPAAGDMASAESRGSVLARALAIAADEDGFGQKTPAEPLQHRHTVQSGEPLARTTVKEADAPLTPLLHPSREELRSRGLPAWAVGVAGVLLGLLIGWLWQRHAAPSPSLGSEKATAAAPSAAAPARVNESARTHRERVARSAQEEIEAAVAASASGSAEPETGNAGALPTPRGGTNASKRHEERAVDAMVAPSKGMTITRPVVSAAATKAVRTLPEAMAPNVRVVDLNAAAEPPGPAGHGPHVRLPGVVTGSSGIMAANVISAPAPAYPPEASAAKVQGEVVIEAVVGRDGLVKEARVVSGPEMLREAAMNAVQRWQYKPYEVDGTPAEIATTARLEFRLNGQ